MESKSKRKFKIDATEEALKKTSSRSGRTAAKGGGGKRKPLADCTNTVTSSQSSSTSVIKPPKSSSTSFASKSQLKVPNSNGKSPGGVNRKGKGGANPSSDDPPLLDWMSVSGIVSSDYSGSVYSRRKSKGKAISESEPLNFPEPEVTTVPNKRGKLNGDGKIGHSRLSAVPVPQMKKQRMHGLADELIKTQKEYFDEIDKFELPVEEVASYDELE